jgi:hypothetical protein
MYLKLAGLPGRKMDTHQSPLMRLFSRNPINAELWSVQNFRIIGCRIEGMLVYIIGITYVTNKLTNKLFEAI